MAGYSALTVRRFVTVVTVAWVLCLTTGCRTARVPYITLTPEEEMVSLVPGGQCVSIWLDQRCRAVELSHQPSFNLAKRHATKLGVRVAQLIYENRHGNDHTKLPEFHFLYWRCPRDIEDGIHEHNTNDWDSEQFCQNVSVLP